MLAISRNTMFLKHIDVVVKSQRVSEIDGLRALAAMSVVCHHYYDLPQIGSFGVQLFFMISGYVICGSLAKNTNIAHFWVHRLFRLYPAYWVSVLAAVIALSVLGKLPDLTQVLINTTMVQGQFGVPYLIDPYWTLAYELSFYAVFSIVAALGLLGRLESLAAAGGIVIAIIHLWSPARNFVADHAWIDLLFMPSFGHLFLIGVMIWRISHGGGMRAALVACCLLSLCIFGRTDWDPISGPVYLASNAAFAGLLYLASLRRLPLAGWAPLAATGLVSYSLYLFHVPVFLLIQAIPLSGPLWEASLPVLALTASLLVSYCVWVSVEVPAQQLARRLTRPAATPALVGPEV